MKELAYLFKDVTTVEVTFPHANGGESKPYTYKCLKSDDLKPGDQVLVYTAQGFKIVNVVKMHKIPHVVDGIEYKWIVQKVDFSRYVDLNDRDEKAKEMILESRYNQELEKAREEFLAALPIDMLKEIGADTNE